jgi:hypothetical protein
VLLPPQKFVASQTFNSSCVVGYSRICCVHAVVNIKELGCNLLCYKMLILHRINRPSVYKHCYLASVTELIQNELNACFLGNASYCYPHHRTLGGCDSGFC